MPSKFERYKLEEILVCTNKELKSNWAKLASLIREYEQVDYKEAGLKARQLMRENTADAYIDAIRANPQVKALMEGKPFEPEKEATPKAEEQATRPSVEKKSVLKPKLSIYEKNFDRLISIIPDLKEQLKNNKHLTGRSHCPPYMDLVVEMIHKDQDSYYLSMAHYFTQNGDLVSDPEMVIRIDFKKFVIEALSYQNPIIYGEVYDNMYKRTMVNNKQKKGQNDFLVTWLKNIKAQGHEIKWDENVEIADSDFKNEYGQPEPKKPDPDKAKTQDEKTPQVKISKQEEMKEEKEAERSSKPQIKQYSKLLGVILDNEAGFNKAKAEKKAADLIESGEIADYVIRAYSKCQLNRTRELLGFNYKLLFAVFPNLKTVFEQGVKKLTLKSGNDVLPIYEIVKAANSGATNQYAVYEVSERKNKRSTLMISVNAKSKMAWVTVIADGFQNRNNYHYDDKSPLSEKYSEQRYDANLVIQNWLVNLNHDGYIKPQTTSTQNAQVSEVVPEQQTTSAEVEKPKSHKEVIDEFKENARKVPDFEPGHVQLCEAHIRAGVTQKNIDKINTLQKTIVLKKKKTMNDNTKSVVMDKAQKALPPGLRLEANGKMYRESRSNRADLSGRGL